MKKKKGFVLREVCGENVIVGEGLESIDFNKLISFNETARFIWESMPEDEFTIDELAEKLTGEYDVDMATAKKDIEKLMNEWKEIGIVEE